MEYNEYLKCARKHIESCRQILEGLKHNGIENKEAFLDVWYLSGYILEGFTVYSAYKIYKWNPPMKWKKGEDIQGRYDKNFSRKSNIDFFRQRRVNGINVLQEAGIEIKYSVQGHGFQEIINNRLKGEPNIARLPVLGDGPVDRDVYELIKVWNPQIRYWYESSGNIKIPELSQDLLERLLNTCIEIYKNLNGNI